MSDLSPPFPILPTTPLSREKKEDREFPAPPPKLGPSGEEKGQNPRGHDKDDFADVASVMGISEDQLTPTVRRAIAGLMAEVDDLRHQLSQSRERETYFAEMADRDSFLPILNQRAFVRKLTRLLIRKWPEGIEHSLVYVDITNAERIKAEHGFMALEGALIHVALLLKAEVRESDVLGSLSGNDFGIILTVSAEPGASDKAWQLKQALESRPVAWVGKLIYLEVACGVYVLHQGDTPEAAIEAADRAARLKR